MPEQDMTEDTAARSCAPGTVLDGRYRVEEVLGRGGFATVYRATQLSLGSAVAIKVLEARRGSPEINAPRFVREARTASQLDHPGLVKVLDFGVLPQPGPYLVMELLKGTSLHEALHREGAMAPARALKLMLGALDALQEAHAQSVIHRDLKPANLFLCHPGTLSESLRILDFGCAFLLEDEVRLTGEGTRLGTPQYIAPEYASQVHISPAQDVYQMAIIFCEMLLGRGLVQGDSPYAMIMAHCEGRLALTQELRRSALWPTLERALRVDHTQRFQDAGAFRDALLQVDPAQLPDSLQDRSDPARLANRPTDLFSGHTAQLREEFHQASTRPLGTQQADAPPQAAPRASFSVGLMLLGLLPVLLLGGGALAWWAQQQADAPPPGDPPPVAEASLAQAPVPKPEEDAAVAPQEAPVAPPIQKKAPSPTLRITTGS